MRLGRGGSFAEQCLREGFIGADFQLGQDLTGRLPDQWRAFNKEFVPVWLEAHPQKTKISAGLACGALWTLARGILKGDRVLSPDGDDGYLSRESHYVWGRRYLLKVVEVAGPASVRLTPRNLVLQVRSGGSGTNRRKLIDDWYRAQLKTAAAPLIQKWERRLGVKVQRLFVQRMKTKWGSCSHAARTIRLNTELAKKPRECLEYLVVHELAHLIEPTHNERFLKILGEALPQWRYRRALLNRLPVRHEHWIY